MSATPAKAAQLKQNMPKPANVRAFRKNKHHLVELPSGHNVLVRRPGMEKFLTAGFLPDTLAQQIRAQISDRSGGASAKAKEAFEALQNPEPAQVVEMMRAVDRVASFCFVEPGLRWHERPKLDAEGIPETGDRGKPVLEDIPEDDRDPAFLYTDELDLDDKMFVFQFAVGGAADLAEFRTATSAAVDALLPSGEVVDAAE